MVEIMIKKNNMIVKISGELDLVVAKDFREKVDELYSKRAISNLIIDFSKVSFIDSSGLGAILGRYKLIKQNNGKMFIFGANTSVDRILDLAGIKKIIPILKTEELFLELGEVK